MFVDIYAQDLTLLVDTYNTIGGLVLGGHEYRFARDTVHVDAGARLKVVKVDETVLGDQIYDTVFLRHLHGHREVVGRLRWEVNVDCLLDERWVRCLMINFYDV